MQVYSWLDASFAYLSTDYKNAHHAHLFTGSTGIGKTQFALAYAQLQLCQSVKVNDQASKGQSKNITAHKPCGECQNCQLFKAGSHPDLHIISSEQFVDDGYLQENASYAERYFNQTARQKRSQAGQFITVDQIRALAEQFANKPHISQRKVAIIAPAQNMNLNAANALLKLLEEPPAESLLLLVCAKPSMLLATIRSRCLIHRLPSPSDEQGLKWLQKMGVEHEKLTSFEVTEPIMLWHQWQNGLLSKRGEIRDIIKAVFVGKLNPLDAASQLAKDNFTHTIAELEVFAHVMIKSMSEKSFAQSVNNITAKDIFSFYDKVVYYRAMQRESINKQLALEVLFSALQKA